MVHQRKQKKIKSRKIRGGFLGFDMSNAKNSLSGHWNNWFSKTPIVPPQQQQYSPPPQQQYSPQQQQYSPPQQQYSPPKQNTPPTQNTPLSVQDKIQNQRQNDIGDIGGKRRKTTRAHKSSRKKSSRKKSSRKR